MSERSPRSRSGTAGAGAVHPGPDRSRGADRGGAAAGADGPGKCQQVWCPVCALAALVSGEQHPLLTVIAEHSVALLTVVRAMVDGHRVRRPDAPTGRRPTSRRRRVRAGISTSR